MVTALGNTGMQSVLPAIGREIGIPDPMVAAIFSLSALLWAFSSPTWAKQSDVRGRKPLIMLGLAGFLVSMILCGVVVSAGVRHLAAPMVIFVLFLLARAVFGLFGSAANPATQAYVAERTSREQRTNNLLRWDVEVPANANGEKAYPITYDFRMELDRQMAITGFQSK